MAKALTLEFNPMDGLGFASKLRLPLIDEVLREQGELTAVEQFSQIHDKSTPHLQSHYYKSLLPASPPGPGQQYAFEVNLDACSGCKACVTACHSLNGLDEAETWRSVGAMHGGATDAPMQITVTTACHHCVDPACMTGCPVGAYEKSSVTGIVKHLDDQCIGCQYCIFTCPYDVPQFSEVRGIVRKCDMCSDRLSEGEAPACVQGCPNEAIAIRVVNVVDAIDAARANEFLPATPHATITTPTTRYVSKQALPANLLPADLFLARPGHQHAPLVWMLVLTQLSVGAFTVDQALWSLDIWPRLASARPVQAILALALGVLALGASSMHLGRPLGAWRAFLGLRTSWLSREILAFTGFAGLAGLYAATLATLETGVPKVLFGRLGIDLTEDTLAQLGCVVVGVGLLGVFCSAMIYHVTRRLWWNMARTGFKFFMTTAILGLSFTLLALWMTAWMSTRFPSALAWILPSTNTLTSTIDLNALASITREAAPWLMFFVVLKMVGESTVLFWLRSKKFGDLKRSAILLTRELWPDTFFRFAFGVLGGLVIPLFMFTTATDRFVGATAIGALLSTGVLLASELAERRTFFTAMSAPRMPGAIGGSASQSEHR